MKLKTKLTLGIFSIALIPLAISFFVLNNQASTILENATLQEEQHVMNDTVEVLEDSLVDLERELLIISKYPPVQGILRSETTGIDPEDGSSTQEWKERLQALFSAYIDTWEGVDQLRFIDENGFELVRVDQSDNGPIVAEEENLQDKSERDYFLDAMTLSEGDIYFSDVDLNVEFGVIEEPHVPIVRIATPIFNQSTGEREGIVIMNYYAETFFETLRNISTFGEVFLIDPEGYFILHPDTDKNFGNVLGSEENYFDIEPGLELKQKELDEKISYDTTDGEYRVWKKIGLNPENPDRYWLLMSKLDQAFVLQHISLLQRIGLLIFVFSVLAILSLGWLFSSTISKPIQNIALAITEISKGNLSITLDSKLLKSKDEIGELAEAFKKTMTSLKMAMKMTAPELRQEKDQVIKLLEEQKAQKTIIERKKNQYEDVILALNSSSLVAKTDMKGNITYVNEKFVEIAKYEEHELLGQNHRILKSGFHTPKFYERLWNSIVEGGVWYGDIRNRAKDGSIYWVRSTIFASLDKTGKKVGYVAIRTPITELMAEIEAAIVKIEKSEDVGEEMLEKVRKLQEGSDGQSTWWQ